jgi:glycosyltransferase involved in cell wall biosynthesis
MSEPQISVIIPNFNHAQFLPRSLLALLRQSIPPSEIIVVDDGSTDNSLEVLKSFAEKHPIVKVCSNERNLGVHLAMNRGLDLARCDYVFFSAADDEVRPGLLEAAARMFSSYPQAGVCSSICEWRCASTSLTWHIGTGMPKERCFVSPAQMVSLGRSGRLVISGPNAVFRKSALIEAGAWIPELRWFCDFFGANVVGFRHGMCHVPEVLANFNLSPGSYYHTAHSRVERREVMERLLRLLESDKYADVAPLIRQSGILGAFGWSMFRVVGRRKKHWSFLNGAFVRGVARRCAEVVGRRFFPNWLARICLRIFYGHG